MSGVQITGRLIGVPSAEAPFRKSGDPWVGTFRAEASGKPTRVRFYRDGIHIGDAQLTSALPERMRRGDTLTFALSEEDPNLSEALRRALALAA